MGYNENKIIEDLKLASFCILAKERDKKETCYACGTGFFISEDGFALTTYHNLSTVVESNGSIGEVNAYYQNMSSPLKLTLQKDWVNEKADIAVLKVKEHPGTPLSYLTPAYLHPKISEDERLETFRGREVYIYGFPKRKIKQQDFLVDHAIKGKISRQVYSHLIEFDEKGNQYVTKRLAIDVVGDIPRDLYGISGGAVLDEETKKVIALECSIDYGKGKDEKCKRIYSSELVDVVGNLSGRLLTDHFQQLPPGLPMLLRKEPSLKEALPNVAKIIEHLEKNK